MDGNSKKPLKIFYKHHKAKGKEYWSAKNRDHLIQRIKIKQKEINQDIKIFEHLKVHMANQNRLQSLQKI